MIKFVGLLLLVVNFFLLVLLLIVIIPNYYLGGFIMDGIKSPCWPCVYESDFDSCSLIAVGRKCHFVDFHDACWPGQEGNDCGVCPQRLVCALSPSYLGGDGL